MLFGIPKRDLSLSLLEKVVYLIDWPSLQVHGLLQPGVKSLHQEAAAGGFQEMRRPAPGLYLQLYCTCSCTVQCMYLYFSKYSTGTVLYEQCCTCTVNSEQCSTVSTLSPQSYT